MSSSAWADAELAGSLYDEVCLIFSMFYEAQPFISTHGGSKTSVLWPKNTSTVIYFISEATAGRHLLFML